METTRTSEYIAANIHVLKQGAALMRRLDDRAYGNHALGERSAIGVHLRHALDFYTLFFEGMTTGRIDYDRRARDKRIEQDRGFAIERSEQLIEQLRQLGDIDADIWVKVDVCADAGDPAAYSRSTLRRELQALISHTIHHYALIAYLMRIQDLETDPGFGVAPSTLDYWQREGMLRQTGAETA